MAIAARLMRFGAQPALNKHLLAQKSLSHLSKDTIAKTAQVFANRKVSDAQLRDKVTKIINGTRFKTHSDASNAWTDLVSAIEEAHK